MEKRLGRVFSNPLENTDVYLPNSDWDREETWPSPKKSPIDKNDLVQGTYGMAGKGNLADQRKACTTMTGWLTSEASNRMIEDPPTSGT